MRFLIASAVVFMTALGTLGQDGIYFSVSGGQKVLGVKEFNDSLKTFGYKTEFKPTFLTYSGEAHFIMGKRFVVGGKLFLFSQEQDVEERAGRTMKIFGHAGIGSLGYAILDGKSNGFRLYPQVGAGLAQTNFQVSDSIVSGAGENKFFTMVYLADEKQSLLKKSGLVVDGCIAMDYDLNFIPSMKCMSGIGTKLLVHAEFGYSFVPGELAWKRGKDELTNPQPELNFTGLYYSVGMGFGFSGAQ